MEKITDFDQIVTRRSPQDRLLFAAICQLLKYSKHQDIDIVLKELNELADTFLEADGTPYVIIDTTTF